MRMRLILVTATTVVAFLMFAPASGASYPGQRPISSPTLNLIVQDGTSFWSDRGIDVRAACPAGVTVSVANTLSDIDSQNLGVGEAVVGRGDNCALTLLAGDVRGMLRDLHRGHDPQWVRSSVDEICEIAWHELGHAYGLNHTDHGVVPFYETWVTYLTADGQINGRYVAPHPALTNPAAVRLMREQTGFPPSGCRSLSRELAREAGVYRRAFRHRRANVARGRRGSRPPRRPAGRLLTKFGSEPLK